MKKIRRVLCFLVVCSFVLSGGSVFAANSVNDLKDQQDAIQNKIDSTENDLAVVQQEKSATMSELNTIETKISDLEAEISKLSEELSAAEAQLKVQETELAALEAKLSQSQSSMQSRVRSIYVNGDISYLDVIFNANSVQDFLSNFVFFQKIVEQDKATINDIRETKQLAEQKLAELKATRNQIQALQESKTAQEAAYTVSQQEKMAVVASLEQEADGMQALIDQFEQDSANIEAEIKAIYAQQEAERKKQEEAAKKASQQNSDSGNSSSSSKGSSSSGSYPSSVGSLGWPLSVSGTRTSNYGYRGSEFHTGIDLAAPKGTPVLAAESGKVIVVKRLNTSYGHYVIIDHGSSISTLYAHMSSINVSVGDWVSRGQQIGGVGSTGRSTGNHLHFEVRVNGSTANPNNYL